MNEEAERGAPYGITKTEWDEWHGHRIYVEKARELGLDVSDPEQVRLLLQAIRYCTIRFAPGARRTDASIAEELGVDTNTLRSWRKKGIIAVATQIVGAEMLSDISVGDARHRILSLLQERLPDALANALRIASGEANEQGQRPSDRDAVAAFHAVIESPVVNAYLQLAMQGEVVSELDEENIEKASRLVGQAATLRLDQALEQNVVEGTILSSSHEEPPLTPSP